MNVNESEAALGLFAAVRRRRGRAPGEKERKKTDNPREGWEARRGWRQLRRRGPHLARDDLEHLVLECSH